MIEFNLAPNSAPGKSDQQVCEIYRHGEFIGYLYPTAYGFRIISRYLSPGSIQGAIDPQASPQCCVRIHFEDQPYQEK